MKIVFFALELWQVSYLKSRIIGHDTEFYTTNIANTKSNTIYDADIICIFMGNPIDKETLNKFHNLKLIATMSTGFDHIDLDECKRRGIVVCNVPAYGDNTVAEHTFGLMLNVSRNIHKAYIRTIQGNLSYEGLMGFDLKGKTLGVIGTGKIGCNVIKIAKGFNMNVLAFDTFQKPELQDQLGFKYVSLEELYKQSEVITIHVPLTKETHHLINDDSISKMKDGVVIINTARGGIIDTEALIRELESGKISGAGLDVLEGELLIKEEHEQVHPLNPLPKDQLELLLEDHALMNMPQVIVTPHIAFFSREGLHRILDTTLQNIFDLIEHRGFPNQVNK